MPTKIAALFITAALFASIEAGLAADPPEYTALEAAKHIGENATVTDKVDDVFQAKGGNIFINMGGKHPNHAFTAFISAADAGKFKDPEVYQDKMITVSGKIAEHKGKPQIIVSSPSQITSKQDDLSGAAASPAPVTPSPTVAR
jgi:RecJ-like exonuclease